jgi:acetoin utilization deacetylase AcuC-like enzyme
LKQGLKRVETELPPIHMVFYMCSNDALKGDPLGKTNVTEKAIYERDMFVVDWARERDLPILIMPSRGYGPSSCRVARESMARINDKYTIF